MSKTQPEIAKAILERRNRMTHVVLRGDIDAAIGPDGLREALQNRWLVVDQDEGCLCVTNDLGKLAEMRKLAEMKPEQWSPEPLKVAENHDLALLHTRRAHPIHEIAAPMTGGSSPGLSTVGQPQQPQQPQPPQGGQPPNQPQFGVGSSVMVARQGLSASGVIEKLNPDGRYQVGFAPGQPKPSGDNIFSKDELSLVPAGPKSPVTAP
jgi:hypothetical protein